MEIDQAITQLGAKLDQWFNGNLPTFASHDLEAQSKALLRGFELAKELDRLKAEGLAAIRAQLNRRDALTDEQYAASLVRSFEFAAKLKHTLHDELLDTDGETKVVRLMNNIADSLGAMSSGRAALALLLDNQDARVRASAGAYLIKLMPERVVPILRGVQETERGNSAHFTAYWAVRSWELEGKPTATNK